MNAIECYFLDKGLVVYLVKGFGLVKIESKSELSVSASRTSTK
jgi:hypothetical protein